MFMKRSLIITFWLLVSGCSTTVDLTRWHPGQSGDNPAVCRVHALTMEKKELGIHHGFVGYLPALASSIHYDFPNYEGPRWVHPTWGHEKNVIAYVCAKCTQAYRKYQRITEQNQP